MSANDVSEAFIAHLQRMRYGDGDEPVIKRRKKITVQPGKSITKEDLPVANVCSSKPSSSDDSRQQVQSAKEVLNPDLSDDEYSSDEAGDQPLTYLEVGAWVLVSYEGLSRFKKFFLGTVTVRESESLKYLIKFCRKVSDSEDLCRFPEKDDFDSVDPKTRYRNAPFNITSKHWTRPNEIPFNGVWNFGALT